MSSMIEEVDSSARSNSVANEDKKFKCKKVHKNQKDKLKNLGSPDFLQSENLSLRGSNNHIGNFNFNNSNEQSNHVCLLPSEKSSNKFDSREEITESMSQFTFQDNNVPSKQDFINTGNSESSSLTFLDSANNNKSFSNAIPGDTKNDVPYIPKVCENDEHYMKFNNFNEKKDKEKLTNKAKDTPEESKKNVGLAEAPIEYVLYESELQMPQIMKLITNDLSEPYSIYTYRYFIHNWPKLCFLAMCGAKCVGVIVCKLDYHKKVIKRGYIAMLAVDKEQRRKGIGSNLVVRAIQSMVADNCDEVVLETEITNKGALHLYENLGFVRDKRLFRYYLNGVDALRLKLWLK